MFLRQAFAYLRLALNFLCNWEWPLMWDLPASIISSSSDWCYMYVLPYLDDAVLGSNPGFLHDRQELYQPCYVSRSLPSKSCSRTVGYVLLVSIKFCQLKYDNLMWWFVGLFASLLVLEAPGNELTDQCMLVYCSNTNLCSQVTCLYLFIYSFIYLCVWVFWLYTCMCTL